MDAVTSKAPQAKRPLMGRILAKIPAQRRPSTHTPHIPSRNGRIPFPSTSPPHPQIAPYPNRSTPLAPCLALRPRRVKTVEQRVPEREIGGVDGRIRMSEQGSSVDTDIRYKILDTATRAAASRVTSNASQRPEGATQALGTPGGPMYRRAKRRQSYSVDEHDLPSVPATSFPGKCKTRYGTRRYSVSGLWSPPAKTHRALGKTRVDRWVDRIPKIVINIREKESNERKASQRSGCSTRRQAPDETDVLRPSGRRGRVDNHQARGDLHRLRPVRCPERGDGREQSLRV